MTRRRGLNPDGIAKLLRELFENESYSVNPDIYVAKDGTESIPHNSNVPGRFVTRNILRQAMVRQVS
ncbi:hypothetical protein TNCV_4464091 [Trichonephila clavipes]|nr:hypothetical protein TNCV_4464091 [Trichonephila clavipes]